MILLQAWWESLQVFHPNNLKNFLNKFLFNYLRATKVFLKYFTWLFFIDAGLFFLSGRFCSGIFSFFRNPIRNLSFCPALIYLLLATSWFVLRAVYLLSIRLGPNLASWHYFKINLIRYFKLNLLFSVIVIFFFNLIIFLGISNFPRIHSILILSVRTVELVTIFYWLDLRLKLSDIFISIEKAINFFVYNLPIFIFIILLALFLTFSVNNIFSLFYSNFNLDATLSTWRQVQTLLESTKEFGAFLYFKILLIKYARFFSGYFILTLIFTFYSMRKNNFYTDSFFEIED